LQRSSLPPDAETIPKLWYLRSFGVLPVQANENGSLRDAALNPDFNHRQPRKP
jgi:hypothetical protein